MASSYFTHLECSSGCGAGPFDPREAHFLCPSCKLPMLARYDLKAARAWKRESLAGRPPNMWRYRELLPLLPGDEPVTLDEGLTPLIHAKRLGATLGLDGVAFQMVTGRSESDPEGATLRFLFAVDTPEKPRTL